MGFEWAKKLGIAHTHTDDIMNHVASSYYFDFYLSTHSIYVVDRTTGAASASVPRRKFDTTYSPLCLTFHNDDIFIINRREFQMT